jgi:hypothetical protein
VAAFARETAYNTRAVRIDAFPIKPQKHTRICAHLDSITEITGASIIDTIVHLPTEILRPILFMVYCMASVRIAPLATISWHWQLVVEESLWEHPTIIAKDPSSSVSHTWGNCSSQCLLKSIYFKLVYFNSSAQLLTERKHAQARENSYSDGNDGSEERDSMNEDVRSATLEDNVS